MDYGASKMIIEIGTKWVKDGEVVEVTYIVETVGRDEVIYYKCKQGKEHISYDYDFLEQYKPYEVVYEYKWVVDLADGVLCINGVWLTEDEAIKVYGNKQHQRLDFTKRERK